MLENMGIEKILTINIDLKKFALVYDNLDTIHCDRLFYLYQLLIYELRQR